MYRPDPCTQRTPHKYQGKIRINLFFFSKSHNSCLLKFYTLLRFFLKSFLKYYLFCYEPLNEYSRHLPNVKKKKVYFYIFYVPRIFNNFWNNDCCYPSHPQVNKWYPDSKILWNGSYLLLAFKTFWEYLYVIVLMLQEISLTYIKTIPNCENTKSDHHMFAAAFLWNMRQK